jgi:hypothetical protein
MSLDGNNMKKGKHRNRKERKNNDRYTVESKKGKIWKSWENKGGG